MIVLLPPLAAAEGPPVALAAPPEIDLVIRDPANNWWETYFIVEGRSYAFDASGTTDDSLPRPEDNVNLTFRWEFGDGTSIGPGRGGSPDFLLNVSHTYASWGTYGFNLTVTDVTNESSTLRRLLSVQADFAAHPNLAVVPDSLAISPAVPEEGVEALLRIGIVNRRGHGAARDVVVAFAILDESGPGRDLTILQIRILDQNGTEIESLSPDQVAMVEVRWLPPVAGTHTARIGLWDHDEPEPWVDAANRQDVRFTVSPPISRWTAQGVTAIGMFTIAAVLGVLVTLRRVRPLVR